MANIQFCREKRRGKKGRRGILDPLFQIVRHCSLKFGCLVWVMVWVMEQAERIDYSFQACMAMLGGHPLRHQASSAFDLRTFFEPSWEVTHN